jgi:hypothetical protein
MCKLNVCQKCGKHLSLKEVKMGLCMCVNCASVEMSAAIEQYYRDLEKAMMN